jgi:hypothetical protein
MFDVIKVRLPLITLKYLAVSVVDPRLSHCC